MCRPDMFVRSSKTERSWTDWNVGHEHLHSPPQLPSRFRSSANIHYVIPFFSHRYWSKFCTNGNHGCLLISRRRRTTLLSSCAGSMDVFHRCVDVTRNYHESEYDVHKRCDPPKDYNIMLTPVVFLNC